MIINATGKSADKDKIPVFVKTEADATIAKSFSHGNLGRTIRFIATSDSHNDANDMASANPNIAIGNKHCGQAIKYISDRIGLDFIAFLGDATWAGTADVLSSYTQQMVRNDIEQFNSFIADGYKGIPNARLVGNHDQCYTTGDETPARLWNSGAYSLFGRYCSATKDTVAGYGYFDLHNAKVRDIYMNTSDIPSATTAGTYLGVTQEQKNWLCETLIDVNTKDGADEWKILILSHAPLDLLSGIASEILIAYTDGGTYNSYVFTNHDAKIISNVHGHVHCYSYGYIESKIRRFCIPNSNFSDNNHYKDNPSYAKWSDPITYPKTANSGKDTAFSLVTIDLDRNMCYVDNYGAGVDREFSCVYNETIPSEYQQVSYIGSSGTQRINTSILAREGDVIECTITEASNYSRNNYMFGVAAPGSATNYRFGVAFTSATSAAIFNRSNTEGNLGAISNLTAPYTITAKINSTSEANGYFTINGSTFLSTQIAPGDSTSFGNSEYVLFALHYNHTTYRSGSCKMQSFKVTRDNVEILNFVPCYRKSDGIVGMYDTVSKTFFTNTGTDAFTKGADV